MKLIKFSLIVIGIVFLVSCSNDIQRKKDIYTLAEGEELPKPTVVLTTDLQIPWSIQKSGDTFYISEREGYIAVIGQEGLTREAVKLEKNISTEAEAGLLGFVLRPDFEETGQAYAYYTYDENNRTFNRVVVLQREQKEWTETKILLDGIESGPVHHGGRIKIGNDGLLYITIGDASVPEKAQNIESLNGKILRMNLDGSIPDDNPFPNSYVYSYGHRNPQGLTWDSDGQLYSSEHGPSAHDELNDITASYNYGWPTIVGDQLGEGMENPLIHSNNETWAPSGMAYYNGSIYFATLRGEAVKRYYLDSGKLEDVITNVGRVRDVFIENDQLYFVSNNLDGRGTPTKGDDQLYQINLE